VKRLAKPPPCLSFHLPFPAQSCAPARLEPPLWIKNLELRWSNHPRFFVRSWSALHIAFFNLRLTLHPRSTHIFTRFPSR